MLVEFDALFPEIFSNMLIVSWSGLRGVDTV